MKSNVFMVLIAIVSGFIGAAINSYLPVSALAEANKGGGLNTITTSELRLINKKGEVVGCLKSDDSGRPELILQTGIHKVSISHYGINITSEGNDEYNYNAIASSGITLGVNNGRDPLPYLKTAQRIELNSGRFNMISPSIQIWDARPELKWATP